MGFNSVYRVLQEVFPQVDARILRAVAIEHTKDVDAAVEVVLTEVMPLLSERSRPIGPSTSNGSGIAQNQPEGVLAAEATAQSNDALVSDLTYMDEEINGSSFYDADGGHDEDARNDNAEGQSISAEEHGETQSNFETCMPSYASPSMLALDNGSKDDEDSSSGGFETRDNSSVQECHAVRLEVESNQRSDINMTSKYEDDVATGNMMVFLNSYEQDMSGPCNYDYSVAIDGMHQEDQSCMGAKSFESSVLQFASLPVHEYALNDPEGNLRLVVVPENLIAHSGKPESSESVEESSESVDISVKGNVDTQDLEGDSSFCTLISRSGQICSIDYLEEIIASARNNKKTLFVAVDSVISLMKEVEVQERAAEQAKEEALKGGLDILARIEDLKQMLGRAKEANDMHAGEVYGEKAILATEVRELQSRLLSLSEERDRSLAILDEMRQTLEERLEVAEREMKEAEQLKMAKEESAKKALADQELIMEKVVQESEMLKDEAEQNSKLREFLMDRGHVVDMLQGEISVICQDVKLLKEKFDGRIPLSKSLFSNPTSCILASSSSSSLKSMAPELVTGQGESSGTLEKASSTASVDEQHLSGNEKTKDDGKELADDGWEFFVV